MFSIPDHFTLNSLFLIYEKLSLYHSKHVLVTLQYCNQQLSYDIFFQTDPHIFKRTGSWKTSLGFYLIPVIIWLDILPANIKLTVTLSSWMTLLYLFLERIMSLLDLLPANYHMTVKSSSHTTVIKTKYEDNSLKKISRTIVFFYRSLIISLENLILVSTRASF